MARRAKPSSTLTDWHRLFGIVLSDYFADSDWEVVRELDLSIKQQLIDIVIVRRGRGHKTPELPDGFGPLAEHNLVTYKSRHEPLDGWALKELVGHSVNYRKQVSPSLDKLLPEESFRLFAVATRFPEKLASQVILQPLEPGVYDLAWGTDTIRVLVLNEIPVADHNALLNLFSAEPVSVASGAMRIRTRVANLSVVLGELIEACLGELGMPPTLEEIVRESEVRFLNLIPKSRLVDAISEEDLRDIQTLIAKRLAKQTKKPTSPRATKGRPKAGRTHNDR